MPIHSQLSKPITIFVAVVAYCVLEVVLFFSVTVGYVPLGDNLTALSALALALTVIPGTAALFSLLTTGRYRRWRRAALYFAIPLAITGTFFGLGFLAEYAGRSIPALAMAIAFIAFGVPVTSIVIGWRISRKRAVEIETRRYLAHVESGHNSRTLHRHDRVVARCLWIPSLIVLVVFLFLPETWGVLSHALRPGKAGISGYRFSVPLTWVVLARSNDGRWLHGAVGKGLARSPKAWLCNGPTRYPWIPPYPIGRWWIFKQADPSEEWPDDVIIERRRFEAAAITCINHISSWERPRWEQSHHSLAIVNCSSPDGFGASFAGDESELPTFYSIMDGVRR